MPGYKIEWLPEAAEDVVRLRQFIKKESPDAAKKVGQRISSAVNLLAKNPQAGMPSPDADCDEFRDLYAPFGKGGGTPSDIVLNNRLLSLFASGIVEKNVSDKPGVSFLCVLL